MALTGGDLGDGRTLSIKVLQNVRALCEMRSLMNDDKGGIKPNEKSKARLNGLAINGTEKRDKERGT